mmetsp:Transcript_18914/g.64085  ORF Transcript_18914/g.64085 Transcript_18914/m.64085 type:complete len:341 (-) Transcript_18914:85-1107(-)
MDPRRRARVRLARTGAFQVWALAEQSGGSRRAPQPAAGAHAGAMDGAPGGDAVLEEFRRALDEDDAVHMAAMRALNVAVDRSTARTWMQLEKDVSEAIASLTGARPPAAPPVHALSLSLSCSSYFRYVSRAFSTSAAEAGDFSTAKGDVVRKGAAFAGASARARRRIADAAHGFVRDGCVVLTLGRSRAVAAVLARAAAEGRRFEVLVAGGGGEGAGSAAAAAAALARDDGVPSVAELPDAGVAKAMARVDLCLAGAELVAESGGVVARLGTFQMALLAAAHGKPVYVAAESYKFARVFPLTQDDVGDDGLDHTPSRLVSLLFTDGGVFSPGSCPSLDGL